MEVNFFAAAEMTRAVLPIMRRQGFGHNRRRKQGRGKQDDRAFFNAVAGADEVRIKIKRQIGCGVCATREVEITGQAAHAGTTPLDFRRDPMRAAAAGMAELYRTIMPSDSDARFTIGRIEARPGSVNAVPERVRFATDLRHPDADVLAALADRIRDVFGDACAQMGCALSIRRLVDMPPTAFPERMVELIEASARRAGLASRRIVSGAFHDALYLARCAPTAMIFCPCRDGISHNEAEHVEPRFALAGANVLLEASLSLLDTADVGLVRPTSAAA